jgi:hypothetical protein
MRCNWLLAALLVASAPAMTSAQGTRATPSTQLATPGAPTGATPSDSTAGDFAVARRTALRIAPDAPPVATLDSAARVRTLAHERGWVRVQVEGWMRESDLAAVSADALSTVSAADVRADPDRFRGQTVRWVVQKIAYQTADPLHRGLAPDEPYLLARGPGSESSLLYLALPPSLVEAGRTLPPFANVVVLARVRMGRSEPSGVPILDVESLAQR